MPEGPNLWVRGSSARAGSAIVIRCRPVLFLFFLLQDSKKLDDVGLIVLIVGGVLVDEEVAPSGAGWSATSAGCLATASPATANPSASAAKPNGCCRRAPVRLRWR